MCPVGRLQFPVLLRPVAHVEFIDAEVSACGAVAMLNRVVYRFQLESSHAVGVSPHGKAATSTEQRAWLKAFGDN